MDMDRNQWMRILKIASVYIGTVIGAGFASGQEILQFFTMYGNNGLYGLVLAGFLFAVIGWAILLIMYQFNLKDYKEFTHLLMGNVLGSIMEWIVALFMLACFCAMLAGTGALLNQGFGLPYQVGVFVMAFACYFTFLYDVKGVIAINVFLVPILFIGTIVLGIYVVFFRTADVFHISVAQIFNLVKDNWLTSAIVYVSYNTITSVVVLASLSTLINNKKVAKWGGILGGGSLGVLGLCLGIATLIYYGKINNVEIPMLTIVMDHSKLIFNTYIIILICAMFTTAVANGYGFISRVTTRIPIKKKNLLNPIIIAISIIIAQMGFSNMVSKIYPIFGYLGIFQVILILIYCIHVRIS